MQTFLTSALLLAAFVTAGIVVIVALRARFRGADADHGAWETALAEYKHLRDKGVLSAEEYRKIRTLVEPRIESGASRAGAGGEPPAVRRCG
ncbi:MAG: SHOCT domain-containing protein [Planctomycetia bacterium]|nr:SHOCT domain-containing protein [Planctomycetia bacterium]